MYARLLARDLAILGAALLLWALVAPRTAAPGALADALGVLAGALLGGGALLAHEWGHWLGALLGRSAIRPGTSLRSLFVFRFEAARNSRAQFVAMSLGGWAGTVLAVWAAVALLPQGDLASRVARGLVWLSAALVVVIEIPLVLRALWTGRMPGTEPRPAPSAP